MGASGLSDRELGTAKPLWPEKNSSSNQTNKVTCPDSSTCFILIRNFSEGITFIIWIPLWSISHQIGSKMLYLSEWLYISLQGTTLNERLKNVTDQILFCSVWKLRIQIPRISSVEEWRIRYTTIIDYFSYPTFCNFSGKNYTASSIKLTENTYLHISKNSERKCERFILFPDYFTDIFHIIRPTIFRHCNSRKMTDFFQSTRFLSLPGVPKEVLENELESCITVA